MPTTAAFIPVRGGSKSIPKKNIRSIAGKPLIYWTAKAAAESARIDCVYIATDDELIASTVRDLGLPKVKVVGRSAETATDTASTESALLEFAESSDCEIIVLIQATSPLLTATDLDSAICHFGEIKCDSLLSAVEQKRFLWSETCNGEAAPTNYDPMNRPRRQDFDGYLVENGAFYIMRKAGLLESRNRLHGKIATWKMDPSTFVEIDEPGDWHLVEHELRKRNPVDGGLEARMKKIKMVLTDVDGVLTDAGMYYSEEGDELKKFNTRDGKGFELLRSHNIITGIVTAENTEMVKRRSKKLGVDILEQGAKIKLPIVQSLARSYGLGLSEIAYIGDDLGDIEVLREVGVSASPFDAVNEVLDLVDHRCATKGGHGCFREFAEMILKSQI